MRMNMFRQHSSFSWFTEHIDRVKFIPEISQHAEQFCQGAESGDDLEGLGWRKKLAKRG